MVYISQFYDFIDCCSIITEYVTKTAGHTDPKIIILVHLISSDFLSVCLYPLPGAITSVASWDVSHS